MKRIITAIIAFSLILSYVTFVPCANAEDDKLVVTALDYFTDEDIKTTADELFSLLEENENTSEMFSAYKNGKYLTALGLFRNYMIDKLRYAPVEPISITGFSWDYNWIKSDIMVGRDTIENLNKKYEARKDLKPVADYEGTLNFIDSSLPSELDWCLLDNDKDPAIRNMINDDYSHGFTLLACRFASTGDPIYVQKLLQFMDDYARNFKNIFDTYYGLEGMSFREIGVRSDRTYSISNYVYMINQDGRKAANYNVSRAQRSNCFIWALHILAKALPGEEFKPTYESSNYHNMLLPMSIESKPYPEAYDYIDPVRFARFIRHLVINEYPTQSESTIYFPGGTPNIAMESAKNSLIYSAILCDFGESINFNLKELIETINQRMGTSAYKDGGALERSFNYNVTDIGGREGFSKTIDAHAPQYVKEHGLIDFSMQAKKWDLLLEMYKSPLGLTPKIGNQASNSGSAAYWKNPEELDKLNESENNTPKPYTSAYLPYSGYGAMRSGWDSRATYMSFFNNPYRTQGHEFSATNAVMNLTAHGRTLLVCSGVPYYGLSYVAQYPEFIKNGYDEINGYMAENSTRKVSTVMVNDNSQSMNNYFFDEVGDYDVQKNTGAIKWGTTLSQTPDDTIDSRWLTNDNFDFCEGYWTGGYTPLYGTMESPPDPCAVGQVSHDADHRRKFIFVKDADLFIVEDELENTYKLENKYRALWHFPAFEEGSKTLTGFKEDQVILDEDNNRFYTADPEGPNLFAYNFSNSDLSYEKYYGYYKEGELGWGWSDGGTDVFTGKFAPRPEVHVLWGDKKRGDITKVATVLAPSENDKDPIVSYTDKSDENINAFEITKADGITVEYYSSNEKRKFQFDGINAFAKGVVVTKKDGKKISALALNCDYFIVNNVTPVYMISEHCAVSFGDNGYVSDVTQFDIPSTFEWIGEYDGEHTPFYGK